MKKPNPPKPPKTHKTNKTKPFDENSIIPKLFIAKSGMEVSTSEDNWRLLPNKNKGHTIKMGWLKSSYLTPKEKALTKLVFMNYSMTKAACTTITVLIGSKPHIIEGFPNLVTLKIKWNGLITSQKKAINQFFGTLERLGYKEFIELHTFTTNHLAKEKIDPLDPTKGRFNDLEYDSLMKSINIKISRLNFYPQLSLEYFTKQPYKNAIQHFICLRESVLQKLLVSILRRPKQISLLKWADCISTSHSFNDNKIEPDDEIKSIGGEKTLQLRVFRIKNKKNTLHDRATPEKYSVLLNENLSNLISKYKRIYLEGIYLMLKRSKLEVDKSQLNSLCSNMPMFADRNLFAYNLKSLKDLTSIFTPKSSHLHLSDSSIGNAIDGIEGFSDRVANLKVNSNRFRHTALTRAAEQGLDASLISKITGVSVPAVRVYVDIDYKSRRIIDVNYKANRFLNKAFNVPVKTIPSEEEHVFNAEFQEIGSIKTQKKCNACNTRMGKPISCYGCINFRPLLEGDHKSVLEQVISKLNINKISAESEINLQTIEKLEKQIKYIKITISICNEIIKNRKSVNDK